MAETRSRDLESEYTNNDEDIDYDVMTRITVLVKGDTIHETWGNPSVDY